MFFVFHFQALLGDDQYVFTRLNKVFDSMPTSKSLTHKLFPRAPTPFKGTANHTRHKILFNS